MRVVRLGRGLDWRSASFLVDDAVFAVQVMAQQPEQALAVAGFRRNPRGGRQQIVRFWAVTAVVG
jgi:hypothetical protein